MDAKNISIYVGMNDQQFEIKTYVGEYPDMMTLLYDKLYLEDFGECKGIGRCGTCHIYILSKDKKFLTREGKEMVTLNKAYGVKQNSRLACQILMDESVDGLHIQIGV